MSARRAGPLLLLAALGSLLAAGAVFEPLAVEGVSMEPGIAPGDRIVVSRFGAGGIARGDVVVFAAGAGGAELLVKRVIGLPGDVVEFRRGVVFVNGAALLEPYLEGQPRHVEDRVPVRVGRGQLYVLGDRRAASRDSRQLGPVSSRSVTGRVVAAYWPLAHAGRVGAASR